MSKIKLLSYLIALAFLGARFDAAAAQATARSKASMQSRQQHCFAGRRARPANEQDPHATADGNGLA